jgi:fluoroacetyl-CoA thioesterase
MKRLFKPGDRKEWQKVVLSEDVAAFGGEQVHPVCSTFALGREMEWASRLFILEMREEDEEGIGTFLEIQHKAPALVGETLRIVAVVEQLQENSLICTIQVQVGERLVATGKTGQKLLKRHSLDKIFKRLREKA